MLARHVHLLLLTLLLLLVAWPALGNYSLFANSAPETRLLLVQLVLIFIAPFLILDDFAS